MSRNQSRITRWMWNNAGFAVRKHGVGNQFHVEARGVAGYILLAALLAGWVL